MEDDFREDCEYLTSAHTSFAGLLHGCKKTEGLISNCLNCKVYESAFKE